MANRSLLIIRKPDDEVEHVIAEATYRVPVLWLGLFREADIAPDSCVPSTTVENSLNQLESALPLIESMFPKQAIRHHAMQLWQTLDAHRGSRISIDFQEIEAMGDPDSFRAYVRYAIQSLDRQVPAAVGRTALCYLSGIDDADPRLYPACLIGDLLEPE
jgi:hypothetical protein